jgi:2-aminoadipate transaminase
MSRPVAPSLPLSADALNFRPSAIRALSALLNDPGVISFAGGAPNPQTFPDEILASHAARAIREGKVSSLQYGPTAGQKRLRELVAGIARDRGIAAAVENVMITTGSQQALSLVSHVLLDPGDVVLVELPTYVGGTGAFYGRRAALEGVAQDDDGIVPESLDEVSGRLAAEGRRVKFLYTIPNFQNPSGRLMSRARREEVYAIARRRGFAILEDDPYGELAFEQGLPTAPIKTLDSDGIVIYLGSFSKILAPSLRCGWIAADPLLLRAVETAKEAADLCSGMLDQAIVASLIESGELAPQVERVRSFYRDRRDTLMEALGEHFGGRASWTRSSGGLFTFLTLADGRDTGELLPRAIDAGVAYVPGAPFFVDGRGRETMRLTFAKEPDDRMRDGVARLARVLF